MIDQNRVKMLRKTYEVSFRHGGLDKAYPLNDAADQITELRDAAHSFTKAISNMHAQARVELTRVGGDHKFDLLAGEALKVGISSKVVLKKLHAELVPRHRSPRIARNILLRGLEEVWRDKHGNTSLPYTSASVEAEAHGEFVEFLKASVKDLPGFELDSNDTLLQSLKRAVSARNKQQAQTDVDCT